MSSTNTNRFIEIGANLLDSMYQGFYHGNDTRSHQPDLSSVLQRATDAGVGKIIITAGSLEESKAALKLARTHESLYSTVGVHPTRCSEFDSYPGGSDAYFAELKNVIQDGISDKKVVAIGEIGLDYDRLQFCDAKTQTKYFEKQLQELAREFHLPLFLHLRAATDDFLQIISQHLDHFPGGVVHSFDGAMKEMQAVLATSEKLDIGINGCSLKTDENLTVAAAVPIERLHFETDAPWCDIRASHAGSKYVKTKSAAKDKKKHDFDCLVKGRNEPCNIKHILEIVAAVKGKEESELAEHVYKNSERVFFSSSSSS